MVRTVRMLLPVIFSVTVALPLVPSAADTRLQVSPANSDGDKPITILIMFDGFRSDYLDRGVTPNLTQLAASGVRGTLTPAFPSVSLPNHFTQITGLYPDEHGVVGNLFEDAAMPAPFNPFKDRESMKDPRWWASGLPLWAVAEEQGLKAVRTFWSANGFDRTGSPGTDFQPMEFAAPPERVSDRFLEWFDGDAKDIPDIAFVLFHHADTAGHQYGPDSPETNIAIAQIDTAVGTIIEGLKQRGLWDRVNIVFTADHGMSKYVPGQAIFLDDLADAKSFRLIGSGPYAQVVPENGTSVEDLAARLVGNHGAMTCWRKEDLPARFRFGKNPRVAAIFCLADPGWIVAERDDFDPAKWTGAGHGYDPESSSMGALFLAHGPAFCAGMKSTQRIDAVDIYPLLAKLSGIKPEKNSGKLSHLEWSRRNQSACSS